MQHGVHAVIARVRESVRTLGAVDLLLVHSAKDLLGPSGATLWRALQALKAEGIIGGIGISAYVADDPVVLAERFPSRRHAAAVQSSGPAPAAGRLAGAAQATGR